MTDVTKQPQPQRLPSKKDLVPAARYVHLVVLGGAFLLLWIFVVDGLLGFIFVNAAWIFVAVLIFVPLARLLHAVGVWVLNQLH